MPLDRLLPLTTALSDTAQQQAVSPRLPDSLLRLLLDHFPQADLPPLDGAALVVFRGVGPETLAAHGVSVEAVVAEAAGGLSLEQAAATVPDETGQVVIVPLGMAEPRRVLIAHTPDSSAEAAAALLPVLSALGPVLALALSVWNPAADDAAAEPGSLPSAEAELRSLFEAMDDVVIVYNAEGRYMKIAPTNTSLLFDMASRMLGKTLDDVLPPDAAAPLQAAITEVLATGQPCTVEYSLILQDRPTWFAGVMSPLEEDQVLLVARDITERRQREEALRKLSGAVEQSANLVIITTTAGLIEYVNPSFSAVSGFAPEDVIGQPARMLSFEEQENEREMAQAMRAGHKWQGELHYRKQDGSGYWVNSTISPLQDENGTITHYLAVQEDITDRRRLEREIRESLERRGRQVQTVTDIAQEIAAATRLDDLFQRIVTLIKERFGYYHAQIFRYDSEADVMRLQIGYGAVGEKMLAAGHSLPTGRGVVGTASATGQSVLAANAMTDPDWVPHPDLPATEGELAVPIKLGDEILGILDVQSETAGALTTEDQLLLEGLCGQIAVAIETTRLLEETTTFRQLVEASAQAVAMSRGGVLQYVNPTGCRLINEPDLDKLIGQSSFSFYPDEDRERLQNEILPIVQEGGSWQGELTLLTVDGQHVSTEQNLFAVRDEAGGIRYVVNLITDITERKAAEQALDRERNLLRTLIDNIPDYVFVKDRQSRMLVNNKAHAGRLFGATPEEVVGTTDFDFFPRELAEQYFADEQGLMDRGEEIIDLEEPSEDAAGNQTWHLTTKVPLRDEQGEVIGLVGIARDITQRKLAEQERERLLVAEREQRFLAETLGEVSLALTSQTDPDAVLDEILRYTRRLVPNAESASIALLQGDQLRVTRFAAEDDVPVLAREAARKGEARIWPLNRFPLTAKAVRTRQPVLVRDTSIEPNWQQHGDSDWIRAHITIPIVLRDRVVGVLWLDGDEANEFDNADISHLQPLVSAAAIALENTRLLQSAQARVQREQYLNTVAAQFQAESDISTLLSTALQTLGLALDARKGRVRLAMPENLDDTAARPPGLPPSHGENGGTAADRE